MKKICIKFAALALGVLVLCSCAESGSPLLHSYCVDGAAYVKGEAIREEFLKFAVQRKMETRDFSKNAREVTGRRSQIAIHIESDKLESQYIFVNLFGPSGGSSVAVYGWHDWNHGIEQLLERQNLRWWLPVDGVCDLNTTQHNK